MKQEGPLAAVYKAWIFFQRARPWEGVTGSWRQEQVVLLWKTV